MEAIVPLDNELIEHKETWKRRVTRSQSTCETNPTVCNCRSECGYHCLEEEEKHRMYKEFWKLKDHHHQNLYLCQLVKKQKCYPRLETERKYAFEYSLKTASGAYVKVCLNAFCDVLGISKGRAKFATTRSGRRRTYRNCRQNSENNLTQNKQFEMQSNNYADIPQKQHELEVKEKPYWQKMLLDDIKLSTEEPAAVSDSLKTEIKSEKESRNSVDIYQTEHGLPVKTEIKEEPFWQELEMGDVKPSVMDLHASDGSLKTEIKDATSWIKTEADYVLKTE